MSTLTPSPRVEDQERDPDRVVLQGVPWAVYERLRDDDANRHVRMSYDHGVLELMSPRYRHEKHGQRLQRLVWILAEELEIPCACAGSTTFRREADEAGTEPDSCFYFAHESAIRGKDDIDLAIDPPPDLAIEIDNVANSRGKLSIYAALRVPEVWRYDVRSGTIEFSCLQADGTYTSLARSECLPMLTPARVREALELCEGQPESRWGRMMREWARALAP